MSASDFSMNGLNLNDAHELNGDSFLINRSLSLSVDKDS